MTAPVTISNELARANVQACASGPASVTIRLNYAKISAAKTRIRVLICMIVLALVALRGVAGTERLSKGTV
jgi:hypothetical protein